MVNEYSGRAKGSQGADQEHEQGAGAGVGKDRSVLRLPAAPAPSSSQVAFIPQSRQNELAFALTDSRSDNLQTTEER